VAEAVDELVGSGSFDDNRGPLVAAGLHVPPDRALGCLGHIVEGGREATLEGARALRWDAEGDAIVAAATPDLLLVGAEASVKAALARLGSPSLAGAPGLADKLEKPAGGVASGYAVLPDNERARSLAATIEADATHIWIHAALGTPSTEAALVLSRDGQVL